MKPPKSRDKGNRIFLCEARVSASLASLLSVDTCAAAKATIFLIC
jgi:hypothetical protein